jgi:ferric-dicitrate binding protein FerR (iron transport regulator)
MSASYEIDLDRRLVIAVFSGDASVADAEEIMRQLYADPRHSFALNRVYDCRETTRLPSISELRALADLFRRRADSKVRTRRAIVVPRGAAYGLGRMLQALLDLAGFELNIFTDLEEAVAWATAAVPATADGTT